VCSQVYVAEQMPLIKRLVEPVDISRSIVAPHITNELECVANNTFAHIVRQLGSLSAHADDLFAELQREATGVLCRVAQLNERVDRVKGRIVKLNPIVEEGRASCYSQFLCLYSTISLLIKFLQHLKISVLRA
jgi:hypothetical protein